MEYYVEWTGFNGNGKCDCCGEIDTETLEFNLDGGNINLCKNCFEKE